MIIGTAGHIDHGKTALIKALTGVDADRLKEERLRGMTIDLGYAYRTLPDGEILGFIDVPGHERFIPNMLAGVTGIDYVLLVIAADDGPKPQTREHLQILDLLGLHRGAVALTKADRVSPERIAEVRAEITTLLKGTSLEDSTLFPVSAITGAGISTLAVHLENAASDLIKRPIRGSFRLAVDRSFVMTGIGVVVTGSVFSGQVRVGDQLLVSPRGTRVRVRGIHAQNQAAAVGLSGQRCALQLSGIERQQVQRGDWLLPPDRHAPTLRLDGQLRVLMTESRPLRHWTPVHAHCGASHATGRIALLQQEAIEPGAEALAQLVLDRPIAGCHGDRIVLRDASGRRTLGALRVLDAHPPARGRRTPRRLAMLAAWDRTSPQHIMESLLASSLTGIDLDASAINLNLTPEESAALVLTVASRKLEGPPPRAFSTSRWNELREHSRDLLAQEHHEVPDALGLNVEQLRLRAAPAIDRRSFGELVAELVAEGLLARDGSWLHLPGHEITFSLPDETLWGKIAPLLDAERFHPPRVRDIAKTLDAQEAAIRNLLHRAARMGRVYRIAHDHYFLAHAVAELAAIVDKLASHDPEQGVCAARFRDHIAVGRKLAIQILEFFDRVGFTRRVKDTHRLRNRELVF